MTVTNIDIFATIQIENIARELERIIASCGITTSINIRTLNNDDINLCSSDPSRYLFLLCPQWVYNTTLYPLPDKKYFIYQLEQFDKSASPHIFNPFVLHLMHNAKHIFDYSNVNLTYYGNKIQIPINKTSKLIPPVVSIPYDNLSEVKDIDVLFCGCMSNRRVDIIHALLNSGIKVTVVNNIFGKHLSKIIKRSKIFLNIRYTDSIILETCRLHEAIKSNDTYIISELPGSNLDSIELYNDRIQFVNVGSDNTELINVTRNILELANKGIYCKNIFNDVEISTVIKNNLMKIFNIN